MTNYVCASLIYFGIVMGCRMIANAIKGSLSGRKTLWTNVYKDPSTRSGYQATGLWDTEEAAAKVAKRYPDGFHQTVPVKVEV